MARRAFRELVESELSVDVRRCIREARAVYGPLAKVLPDGHFIAGITHTHAGELAFLLGKLERVGEHGSLVISGSRVLSAPVTIRLLCRKAGFGGVRWYALCGRCLRPCERVFIRYVRPSCRRCLGLVYNSTRLNESDRMLVRTREIKRRLKVPREYDHVGLARLPPSKPKGMWESTYQRHMERWEDAEARHDRYYQTRMVRLLTKIEKRKAR